MKLVAATPNSTPLPEPYWALFNSISQDYLRDTVKRIAVPRVYGTAENEAVCKVIVDLLSDAQSSITVDKVGSVIAGDPRQAKFLIGAHYDAIPGTPGADDNASAVAVLLSAAKVIGPHKDLCNVAFNGEECGFVGSSAFVEALGCNCLEQVHILEMVGFTSNVQKNPIPMVQCPEVGDFLGLVGTHQSRHVLDHVLACARCSRIPVLGLYLPEVPLGQIRALAPHVFRSDHDPFWCRGIPALMWTDTAEFRNPNYHQPTDTPDTLNYDFMAEVTRLLIHVVLSWLD